MAVNTTNSEEYYNDENRHGEYQCIKLEDIINNYALSRDADDYTASVPRYQILYQARRGMRELYYDIVRDIRAIALELSPQLNVILPPDYINYVRISWVDDQGMLHPMAVDSSMSIATEYLQDHEYNILFDNEGCPLEDSGTFNQPTLTNQQINTLSDYQSCGNHYYGFCNQFHPNKDLSRHFPNGKYRINKSTGIIQFGSDAFGRTIVLEYISDGLYTGCEGRPESEIKIHKFAEDTILNWIYWKLIERRRNVPMNEKMRARKEYFNSRRISKRRINTIRKDELLQVFKGDTKWIK